MKRTSPKGLKAPSSDSVALITVTYCPSATFVLNLTSAAAQFVHVIVVDNTEIAEPILDGLDESKFDVIFNDRNVGLGEALNIGCRRAMDLGYEWALTLDQDTQLLPNFLRNMLLAWDSAALPAVVLGSNYYNVVRSENRIESSDLPKAIGQTTVITSGSLTHLPTWSDIGMFRGDYFIDSIDHEFCLRVRKNGYEVAISCQVGMKQYIGEETGYKGKVPRFLPYRHSHWRKYTASRNTIRTVMDYAWQEPLWVCKRMLDLFFELLAILLVEPKKASRLKAFWLGVAHGLQGRLGVAPEEIKLL